MMSISLLLLFIYVCWASLIINYIVIVLFLLCGRLGHNFIISFILLLLLLSIVFVFLFIHFIVWINLILFSLVAVASRKLLRSSIFLID